jgi:hypothetical protein
MRTVALAPRLRRNGCGPLDRLGLLPALGGRVDAATGLASMEIGLDGSAACDGWTAGNPMTVRFRGGREEAAVPGTGRGSGFGGAVMMGGAEVPSLLGRTNPCIVGL